MITKFNDNTMKCKHEAGYEKDMRVLLLIVVGHVCSCCCCFLVCLLDLRLTIGDAIDIVNVSVLVSWRE